MCMRCNLESQLSLDGSSCNCIFNYTISVLNTNRTKYTYSVDNYLNFTSDIPNNLTLFNCSDLVTFDFGVAESGNMSAANESSAGGAGGVSNETANNTDASS